MNNARALDELVALASNKAYTPKLYRQVVSAPFLRPAQAYKVGLDRNAMFDIIDKVFDENVGISLERLRREDNRHASLIDNYVTEIENDFIDGFTKTPDIEKSYSYLVRILADIEQEDVEDVSQSLLNDIYEETIDALSDEFSIFPVNYEPTGYEHIVISRNRYITTVSCMGDKRILMYHDMIPTDKEDTRDASYHPRYGGPVRTYFTDILGNDCEL